MPVHRCMEEGKPGYQWGSATCYTYASGDEAGRKAAKRKAIIQGYAATHQGGATETDKQLTSGDVHVPTSIGNTLAARRRARKDAQGFTILKADEAQRKVIGVVFEPQRVDTQGDYLEAPEIEEAAHQFLEGYRKRTTNLWLGHERPLGDDEATLIENYITRADQKIGTQDVPAGSWVQGWRLCPPLWEKVAKGEMTGFSFGGSGVRDPVPEDALPQTVKRAAR